ncbi:MAG: 30S ribosomal protein S9 [Patescibacteria group bacterium]|nr:30S ribosomal protein S9 [Patescibacteria group bacterium]
MIEKKTIAKAETSDPKSKAQIYFYAVGRRKTAVARVRLYSNGSGEIEINEKAMNDYFTRADQAEEAIAPLKLLEKRKDFDFTIRVAGGGLTAQAEAIRHGIARALVEFDGDLRPELKKAGYLRRDARKVERKKPGLRKARRAAQFSKR